MPLFNDTDRELVFQWLCEKRKEHSANNDIWDMRRQWDKINDELLSQLNDGTYMFSPLQRFEFTDEIVSMWSCADMIALKLITQALEDQMQQNLSKACYHTKGNGGLKKALIHTYQALESHYHFYRSDIKSYYESIRFDTLIKIIEKYVKDPLLLQLIMKALNRIETFGGNFYEYPFKGIPKRSPLSPLLAAIALLPLDQAMEANPHIFYARFVDDWVVLTKSKTMLRKIIKQTHGILKDLHLEMHPTKTYIGRIEKGFNFLTYFMKKDTILPSKEGLRRFSERASVLYEQQSPSRFPPKPNRDISEYHVNEGPPTDEYMQNILFTLNWGCKKNTDKGKRLQTYLSRWIQWINQGLNDSEDYQRSIQEYLPTMMLCTQLRNISDIVYAIVID